jgi:hypothetical protein
MHDTAGDTLAVFFVRWQAMCANWEQSTVRYRHHAHECTVCLLLEV